MNYESNDFFVGTAQNIIARFLSNSEAILRAVGTTEFEPCLHPESVAVITCVIRTVHRT
jgi:hypothetical protein